MWAGWTAGFESFNPWSTGGSNEPDWAHLGGRVGVGGKGRKGRLVVEFWAGPPLCTAARHGTIAYKTAGVRGRAPAKKNGDLIRLKRIVTEWGTAKNQE